MSDDSLQKRAEDLLRSYSGGMHPPVSTFLSSIKPDSESPLTSEARQLVLTLMLDDEAFYAIPYLLAQDILGATGEVLDEISKYIEGDNGVLKWTGYATLSGQEGGETLEDIRGVLQGAGRNRLTESVVGDLTKTLGSSVRNILATVKALKASEVQLPSAVEISRSGDVFREVSTLLSRFLALEPAMHSADLRKVAIAEILAQLEASLALMRDDDGDFPPLRGGLAEEVSMQIATALSAVESLQHLTDIFGELIDPDTYVSELIESSEKDVSLDRDPLGVVYEHQGSTKKMAQNGQDLLLENPVDAELVFQGSTVDLKAGPDHIRLFTELILEEDPNPPPTATGVVYSISGASFGSLAGADYLRAYGYDESTGITTFITDGFDTSGAGQNTYPANKHVQNDTSKPLLPNYVRITLAPFNSAVATLSFDSVWIEGYQDIGPGTEHILIPDVPPIESTGLFPLDFPSGWANFPLEVELGSDTYILYAAPKLVDSQSTAPLVVGDLQLHTSEDIPIPQSGDQLKVLNPEYTDGSSSRLLFFPYTGTYTTPQKDDRIVSDGVARVVDKSWGYFASVEEFMPQSRLGSGSTGKVTPISSFEVSVFGPVDIGDKVLFPPSGSNALGKELVSEVIGFEGSGLVISPYPDADYLVRGARIFKGSAKNSYRVFTRAPSHQPIQLDLLKSFFTRQLDVQAPDFGEGFQKNPTRPRDLFEVEMSVTSQDKNLIYPKKTEPYTPVSLNHISLQAANLCYEDNPATIISVAKGGARLVALEPRIALGLDPRNLGQGLLPYGNSMIYDLETRNAIYDYLIFKTPTHIGAALDCNFQGDALGPLAKGGPVPYAPFGRAAYYLDLWARGESIDPDPSFRSYKTYREDFVLYLTRARSTLGESTLSSRGIQVQVTAQEELKVSGGVTAMEMNQYLGADITVDAAGYDVQSPEGFPHRIRDFYTDSAGDVYLSLTPNPFSTSSWPAAPSGVMQATLEETWVCRAYRTGVLLRQRVEKLEKLARSIHPVDAGWYTSLVQSASAKDDQTMEGKLSEYRLADIFQGFGGSASDAESMISELASLVNSLKLNES